MRSTAEPGWWLWVDVPEGHTGIWRVSTANGWHYIGAFSRGKYLCAWTCNPEMDDDTRTAFAALMEASVDCSEPRIVPMRPASRVLPFPVSQSAGA